MCNYVDRTIERALHACDAFSMIEIREVYYWSNDLEQLPTLNIAILENIFEMLLFIIGISIIDIWKFKIAVTFRCKIRAAH